MRLGEKTRLMSRTITIGSAFVLFILIFQVASIAYFALLNRDLMSEQRVRVFEQYTEEVAQYYRDVDAVVARLQAHPAVLELKHRNEISNRNFEKLHRLINQLDDLRLANGGKFDVFIRFPKSERMYSRTGLLYPQRHETRAYALLPESDGQHLLADVSVETSEGTYRANLCYYQSEHLEIIAACPIETLVALSNRTLAGAGAEAAVLNAEGQVLAASSAMVGQDMSSLERVPESGYPISRQERDGLTILIGYNPYTPLQLSARINVFLSASTIAGILLTGLLLWLFRREIYQPMLRIVRKMGIDDAPTPGGEYARIDAYISHMSSRVSAMSHDMSQYDEILFENTLNKIALQLKVSGERLDAARSREYLVMTAVCEAPGGRSDMQQVAELEATLGESWRLRRVYLYGMQVSYYVEIEPGDLSAFEDALRSMELAGYAAFGLSALRHDLGSLRQALEESREALLLMTDSRARLDRSVCAFDGRGAQSGVPMLDMAQETGLINNMLKGDADAVDRCLDEILHEGTALPVLRRRELCLYLLNLLSVYRKDGDDEKASGTMALVRDAFSPGLMSRITRDQFRGAADVASKQNQTLNAITDHIRQHYSDPSMSLQSVSDHMGMSYSYLSKYLKQSTGIGFSDYLAHVRIDAAKKLLIQTDAPIGDIASQVGFEVFSSFSRSFKNNAGISPGEYRKLYA